MVADALSKLAIANVIQIFVDAMYGRFVIRTMAHYISVTLGRTNRFNIAGYGSSPKLSWFKHVFAKQH